LPSLTRTKGNLFYGWVVVATFLLIGTICYGLNSSFGVFFKSIANEFILTRTATSTIFSVQLALGCVFALIGGWFLDRHGPKKLMLLIGLFTGLGLLLTSQAKAGWQLFISYSLLVSTGAGPIWVITTATTLKWFDKKRGLALGIAGSGIGLGAIAVAPLAAYLISEFDWRMAYIIMGLIAWLMILPLSRLLKRDPNEIGTLPDGVKTSSAEAELSETRKEVSTQYKGLSLSEACRIRSFWLFGAIWLLYSFCYFLMLTHIVPHATDIGIPAMKAATVISLIGSGNLAGRLIMGKVADSIGRKKTAITCALLLVGAMAWVTWSHDLWMYYIFGIVFGFSHGGLEPSLGALIGDIFGMRSIGTIMGILEIAWGVGAAIGPAIGGLIFDINGSYSMAFVAGLLAVLILVLLISLVKRET